MKQIGIRLTLTVMLFCAIVGRICWVNATAYDFQEEVFQQGEWVPLEGDFFYSSEEYTEGYSVRVSLAEALPYEKFMERFGKPVDYLGEQSRYDVILLKVDFKNDGNTQGGVFIRDFNLKNEARSEYFNPSADYMAIANPEFDPSTEGIRIQPGTEVSLYFVYDTLARADGVTYLEEQQTKNSLTMLLNVSLYPVNKMIEMTIPMDCLAQR